MRRVFSKMYKYDKDELKQQLTIEQISDLVSELGGEPRINGNVLVSRTICHNPTGSGSYKLYYYDNTKLFRCYTDCGDVFDIFELVKKVKNINGEYIIKKSREGNDIAVEWDLPDAINYVASYFGFSSNFNFESSQVLIEDWDYINNYNKTLETKREQIVDLKVFDKNILKHLPHPIILPWIKEGITQEIIDSYGIAYDPKNQGIVIPHYDIGGNLIGVRERTLVKESEELYGKYHPAILNKIMYNHPLSFNLYNLNNSKDNIKKLKKVIVFEGEKSCLLYASYFGKENDITVACCGSSLIRFQVDLLLSLGVQEIIVAFDKQFKELNDDEWKRWTKKLKEIHNKYHNFVQISFMFDTENLLEYKDSPIDQGPQIFLELFKERIIL